MAGALQVGKLGSGSPGGYDVFSHVVGCEDTYNHVVLSITEMDAGPEKADALQINKLKHGPGFDSGAAVGEVEKWHGTAGKDTAGGAGGWRHGDNSGEV